MNYPIRILLLSVAIALALGGCIGTDVVDDLTTRLLTVTIKPPDDPTLEVGETLQLTAQVANGPDDADEVTMRWTSSRPEVLSVSETGLVTALAEGTADITVVANGVTSEPYPLAVGEAVVPPVAVDQRTGALAGQGGYQASGTVTLRQDEDGTLQLITSDDFTVSVALGTFLYLSNSKDGPTTASTGLQVADVSKTASGAQTFDVTQLDASVALDTYQYVIVLCKPAQLTFGSAELN